MAGSDAYAFAYREPTVQLDEGADRGPGRSAPRPQSPTASAFALTPESRPSDDVAGETPSDRSAYFRAAEDRGAPEPDEENRRAANGGGGGGGGGGSGSGSPPPPPPPPKTPTASLALTGDAYTDTATSSKKDITFNATWSGGAKEDYIIVNWLKGYEKNDKGKPYKVTMYDKKVDFDFADWQVDSIDKDPAYWSNGGRWNYTVDGPNAFSATDSPGPMNTSDGVGAEAKVSFKTAVYKSADVPTTTTGTLAATPLSSFQPWEYNVLVQGGGKFKH